MWPLILGIVSAIGSGYYLWQDHETSKDIEDSVSQMEAYIELLAGRMSLSEFIDAAWPSLLIIAFILLVGYIIATPQRRRVRI